jgi:MFS transporter, DHA2 family, multidrug resistance protein
VAKREAIFDHRRTLHSVRLVDVANRPSRTLQPSLSILQSHFAPWGVAANPLLGAVKILQSNLITQSRLLSYIRYISVAPF